MADILIVEDDPLLGRLWQKAIGRAGHAVRLAATASEARRALLLQAADLVILDLNLGPESGLGTVTLAAYANPAVRVLVTTGSTLFPRGELFAMAPCIAAVLRKPVPPEEIIALIEHHRPADAPGAALSA